MFFYQKDIAKMESVVLKDLLCLCLIALIIFAGILISLKISLARLKQKNYFLNRDRERYAQTLYASKDGDFSFIYPDERINDPRRTVKQHCSARLAVMLDLKSGKDSVFEDVLAVFYKEDAKKIQKYLHLMQSEGIGFEDTFKLKTLKKSVRISGSRINGKDGNLYADTLWFKDLEEEMLKIQALEEQNQTQSTRIYFLQNLLDNISYPVWLRDELFNLLFVNKKYTELAGASKEDLLSAAIQPEWAKTDQELFNKAVKTNKTQQTDLHLPAGDKIHCYTLTQTPFHYAQSLDKIGTVGTLSDITALENIKRDFKIHQNANLEVLSALGTAIAIFSPTSELIFYNPAFLQIFRLDAADLEENTSFARLLDTLRAKRMLPEVSDYKAYKTEAEKLFGTLIAPKETLLHLPDGRTLRRLVAPHPNGLIFAIDDVSDRLSAERTINEILAVQQNILDQSENAILIFAPDQTLKNYNKAYLRLFGLKEESLKHLLNISETFEMQRPRFSNVENWENLKQNMLSRVIDLCAPFKLELSTGTLVEVTPAALSDNSLMLTYKKLK